MVSFQKASTVRRVGHARATGLARVLSKMGYCSRAEGARLIRSGKVRVNGAVRRDPESPVHIGKDRVEVAGKEVRAAHEIYLMLNKPRGIVTTAADERNRETVYKFLGEDVPWVAPVGRLDKASEGLLLLTNDTEWAGRITDPETHLDKAYHVQIGKIADEALVDALNKGVRTSDGEVLRAKSAALLRQGERHSWLEIVLDEGKNRQIRRMLEASGTEVLRLLRVAIGPLPLGDLPKGTVRALTPAEKLALDRAMRTARATR